ncbi:DUF779 domain-containing protein [Tessaracoccus sp. HDW20]|uniref:DUF779 domain-containing protein n=1 Tax=Tessaracoccus coleopterorum TaxID=2714950 RepID=UPI0018D39B60|nr:DUF779 domain-containing protein [Tessaracoccus coleopterorum]NHB84639.1 DUF779 domain-containing protein [Tessaracoccus coleopterorum]
MSEPRRVEITDAAADLLRTLAAQHGPLMFHQSGGCCDGSSPMCYPVGMFLTGSSDVLLETLAVEGIDPVEGVCQINGVSHGCLTLSIGGRRRAVRRR